MKILLKNTFLMLFVISILSCTKINYLNLNPETEAHYVFREADSKLFGLLNKKGGIVIDANYKYIGWEIEGLMPVFTQDELFVFIDNYGKIIGKEKFWDISLKFNEDLLAVACPKNKKWGFVNRKLSYVITPEYDEVGYFVDGITVAKKHGKWGVIDKNGMVVIGFAYDKIKGYNDGVLIVQDGSQINVIDVNNKRRGISDYERFFGMVGNSALVEKNEKLVLVSVSKESELMEKPDGIIYSLDRYFDKKLKKERYYIHYTHKEKNHIAIVCPQTKDIVKIFSDASRISETEYEGVLEVIYKNRSMFVTSDFKHVWLSAPKHKFPYKPYEKIGIVYNNDKVGVADKLGNMILDFGYGNIFFEGQDAVYYSYEDKKGFFKYPDEFVDLSRFEKIFQCSNIVFAEKKGKIGILDKGKIKTPPKYTRVLCGKEESIAYVINNKWGLIDPVLGQEITPPVYDNITPFVEGVSRATNEGRLNFIDRKGKVLFEIDTNKIDRIYRNVFVEPILYSWGLTSIVDQNHWFSRDLVKKKVQ
jgi:hypothetical protein